jgi:hypothetical protein
MSEHHRSHGIARASVKSSFLIRGLAVGVSGPTQAGESSPLLLSKGMISRLSRS